MSQKTVTEDRSNDPLNDVMPEGDGEYTSHLGDEPRQLDVASDDHPVNDLGSDGTAERTIDERMGPKLFVERYDENKKAIRELMANSHTACVQRCAVEVIRNTDRKSEAVRDMLSNDVRGLIEIAKNEANYHPTIEVGYNRNKEARWTFRIEDNGIGISRSRLETIQSIGKSGWHMLEGVNGQFGQGRMSAFLLSGVYGEFRNVTYSVRDEANYGWVEGLHHLNGTDDTRDDYGTTIEFPTFSEDAQKIDVASAVSEYAEGMIIPVIYTEYDSDGKQDGIRSDDFTPSYLEDLYDEDYNVVVSYEDETVKAVWSNSKSSSSNHTWSGYQPIERNDSRYGTNDYEMPSTFDVRVKVEDGRVYEVRTGTDEDGNPEYTRDHELVGKVPVNSQTYEHVMNNDSIPDDRKAKFVRYDEVPDGSIITPTPTDDRDRFEKEHVRDFFKRVSHHLKESLREDVAEVYRDIDDFDDVIGLSSIEQQLFNLGCEEFLTVWKRNDPDRLSEQIKEEFGADVDTETTKMIDEMEEEFSLAPRSRSPSRISKKTDRTMTEFREIVEKAGDEGTVYFQQTLTAAGKVALAWELHEDNQVVSADTSEYDRLENEFGWTKLKELPSRNFEENFPNHDFDDDFLQQWDRSYGSSSGSSGGGGNTSGLSYDDKRAKRRNVKVRKGVGGRSYSEIKGGDLFDALNNPDKEFGVGTYSNSGYNKLLLYKQTEGHTARVGRNMASKDAGLAYAVVPNYVFDYLHKAERAFTPDEYKEYCLSQMLQFDWTNDGNRPEARVDELTADDVVLHMPPSTQELFEDYNLIDDLRKQLENEVIDRFVQNGNTMDSLTIMYNLDEYHEVWNSYRGNYYSDVNQPTFVTPESSYMNHGYSSNYEFNAVEMFFDAVLPGLDRTAPEWDYFNVSVDDDDKIALMKDVEAAGGFVSTDANPNVPDTTDSVWSNIDLTAEKMYAMKTLERVEAYRNDQ